MKSEKVVQDKMHVDKEPLQFIVTLHPPREWSAEMWTVDKISADDVTHSLFKGLGHRCIIQVDVISPAKFNATDWQKFAAEQRHSGSKASKQKREGSV